MTKKKIILILVIWIIIGGVFLQSFQTIKSKERMAAFEISDSVKTEKGRFQNIEPTKVMQGMSKSTMKAMVKKGEKVPEQPLPFVNFDASPYENPQSSELSVVWFGHSCALISMDEKLILTDPALSTNAGPTSFTGTKRFHKKIPVTPDQLPPIDVVLLSHDHFDHLDKKSIQQLDKKVSKYMVPLGVAKYLIKWGVDREKIEEKTWWDKLTYNDIQFISTPARHFSGRGLFDRNTTLWCSWVIKGKQHSVFFSGDSGYQKAFKVIGEKYGPFDLSLLECGQYNDDWGLIHMSPEESVQAGIDSQTRLALPIHWGAFSLSVHSWYEPIERFREKAQTNELPFIAPKIGERVVINDSVKVEKWWN